jgi:hypothetical protein
VGRLNRVHIKIEVSPDGAAHGIGDYGFFPQPHLINEPGDYPLNYSVAAAAAVFGRHIAKAFWMAVE